MPAKTRAEAAAARLAKKSPGKADAAAREVHKRRGKKTKAHNKAKLDMLRQMFA